MSTTYMHLEIVLCNYRIVENACQSRDCVTNLMIECVQSQDSPYMHECTCLLLSCVKPAEVNYMQSAVEGESVFVGGWPQLTRKYGIAFVKGLSQLVR